MKKREALGDSYRRAIVSFVDSLRFGAAVEFRAACTARPLIRLSALLTVLAVVTAFAGNALVGLSWGPPLWKLCFMPAWFFGVAVWFRTNRTGSETSFYLALWLISAVAATRLTYLAASLDFPMQDRLLAAADAALGFHWIDLTLLEERSPVLFRLLHFAYGSSFWQPLLSVLIFSISAPRRNEEFLAATIISLGITAAISALLPALGPGHAYGMVREWEPIIASIRSGTAPSLPYMGIVTFPSFHAAVAVLLILAHRGLRWTFWPVLVMNLLMLGSIPVDGDHYLVDVIAGISVAFASYGVAERLTKNNYHNRDEEESGGPDLTTFSKR
jgi:hypothetical protein